MIYVLKSLLEVTGLVPRSGAMAGNPDRGTGPVLTQGPSPEPKPARKKKARAARPDDKVVVSWGDGKMVRATVKRDLDDGAAYEYDISGPAAAPLVDIPWSLYDEQALAKEQAVTPGFTRDEYNELRLLYLADRKLTNKAVGELKQKSQSWSAKRMRAVRKAVKLADADIAEGKPLPQP